MLHEKINKKLPPLKKQQQRKISQDKEDKIERNLQMSNQTWNVWKFQIHWNKLEWVNPRNISERKESLLCFF